LVSCPRVEHADACVPVAAERSERALTLGIGVVERE
jgi:hypothetical protein